MTIHSNLRQLRLARGMTQEQAAEQLHLTRQAISSYEKAGFQREAYLREDVFLDGKYQDVILMAIINKR